MSRVVMSVACYDADFSDDEVFVQSRDRNFDELGERFARNIYGSNKGRIRQDILWRHLLECLPALEQPTPLKILDAGCGLGQLAARLAMLGHRLTLCDISAEMLETAKALMEEQRNAKTDIHPATCHLMSLQDMPQTTSTFDVILCHAVLEWLADPETAVPVLAKMLRLSGYLSLSFYNRDALIYRNLINGNLRKVKSGQYAGHRGGLTPATPLSAPQVLTWLEGNGFSIESVAGLRVFFDFIPRKVRERLPIEDILELEREYSRQQPYIWLARYIHVIARRCDA